tara:strand:+ start:2960 stop:3385 length:426 start_codon:yes stop_codon:yes gene_type:complete
MKKNTLFGLLFLTGSLFAQENNCYQKYIKVFEVRGANIVEDGNYDDVIITIRKGSYSDCLIGKVKVSNGIVDPKSIQLTFVDGSFESFDRSYKYEDPITIINGVSKTMVTKDEELINVMFVDAIKPKKKAFKRAPEPEFDL